jgi:UDP-N-acetylglucosamine--N-acetylmuramyl-(pentapeptide) pyrophosphoryl-undecaprenol N-acetylglucosamine transferase
MTGPIVLAAGGTGGHVFPAQALASVLIRRGRKVILITDTRRGAAYSDAFPNVDVMGVRAGTPTGKSILGKLLSAGDIARGTFEAALILRRLKPAVVVGFGGYPSLPSALGAIILGVPLCLHEQNAVLGRVNRVLARRSALIATSFARTDGIPAGAAITLTGNPVRQQIADVAEIPYNPIKDNGPIRLLVFGGSQGARIFSDIVPAALRALPFNFRERIFVTQQVRPEHMDMVRAAYADAGIQCDLRAFLDDMPMQLSQAHLVIGRGGASTIAELIASGRPSLIAPYPHHKDQHQLKNALNLVDAGAGWVLPDALMTPPSLALKLATLIATPGVLTQTAAAAKALARLDAAEALADALDQLISGDRTAPAATRSAGTGAFMREVAR